MKRPGQLARSGPPARRARLDRGAPLRPRSTKADAAARRRSALVQRLAAEGVRCEVGHVLAAAGVTPFRCSGALQGIHERRKRSSAGSLEVADNLVPSCNWCNGWIEDRLPILLADDPDRWAPVAAFLVLRPGDPGFDDAGVRAAATEVAVRLCSSCGYPHVTVGPERGRLVAPCGHQQGAA